MENEGREEKSASRCTLRPAALDREAGAVAGLMAEYLTWAHAEADRILGIHEPPSDLDAIPESLRAFQPPAGTLIVADCGERLAGVAALRATAPGVLEIKRMYVTPQWRGTGLGSALLDRLLDEARSTPGVHTVRLDTCSFMTDAQRLYESRRFVERSPYEGTEIPPHLQHHWRFFERQLADPAVQSH